MRIVVDLQSAQGTSKNRGMGRYSLALAQAMVKVGKEHEIWIALNGLFPNTIESLRRTFEGLVPSERIVVWKAPGPAAALDPANTWRREAAELIRESFLVGLEPDIVYVTSLFEGLGDDCVTSIGKGSETMPTAVTLYDLIPLIFDDLYLWDERARSWYYQKLQWVKNADLWLAISEHTRQDAIEHLGLPEDRVVNISAGFDPKFRPIEIASEKEKYLRDRYGIKRPFVAYTPAAIEPRKNVEGLIQAFGRLPENIRKAYQLVIICDIQEHDRKRLLELAKRAALKLDDVIFTGFVPYDDLIALYNLCTLFIFPSLYEGFGLPPLEAMACGAPVIASNASSLPEVVGWEKALFDPKRSEAIAEKMYEALTNDEFRQALRQRGLEQAKRFSWEESARRALAAFETFHIEHAKAEPHPVRPRSPKPRLAYLSPLPPARSGIANYSRELLPELARYYQIELIVDQPEVSDPWLSANFPIRNVEWFDKHADRYDRILYHFGNSEFHKHMFELLKKHSGVVVLHDFYLGGVLHWMDHTNYAPGIFRRELYRSHGYPGLSELAKLGEETVVQRYPCSLSVVEGAEGVIFPSERLAELTKQWLSKGSKLNWWVIRRESQGRAFRELAKEYFCAIEHFADTGRHARRRRLISAIAQNCGTDMPTDEDLVAIARAITMNQTCMTNIRQILVDISTFAQVDYGTGIQRVTRAHLKNLLANHLEGWRVEPVYAVPPHTYRYARDFTARYLGLPPLGLSDEIVEVNPGDVFLGLDLTAHLVVDCAAFFTQLKACRAQIFFLVYDLLPVCHPKWFPQEMHTVMNRWLKFITQVADGIVCISRTAADELFEWLENNPNPLSRTQPLKIGYFHLGADVENAQMPIRGEIDQKAVEALNKGVPLFLMVGTIEPRKGHAQALDAFEMLWNAGIEACLVIVGKEGWMVESLVKRLRSHPEQGKRLFWLEGASDATLLELYRRSTVLLMASYGKGFGLPLIEAARHGLPIIARDIPVFREVCGEHAFYFKGDKPEDLAEAIEKWLELYHSGKTPSVKGMKVLTWEESTQQLLHVILDGNWYKVWEPK